MFKATALLLLFALSSPAAGRRMRWIPNVDLNNPDNWEPKGAPCRNDHVMFPAKAPPVYVQTNQTLLELVLPNDGEIIFADGMTLTFPETPDSSCKEKNILFTGVTPKSWFDPVNWCITSEVSLDCLATQPDLLDTERIPCLSDDVAFVPGSSFFVDLQSDAEIRIASLRLGNEQMNTETFRSYLVSESGRKRFVGQNSSIATPTNVTIIGGSVCADVTGCSCGNLRSSSRICAIQSARCSRVSCTNSIQPDGHCCDICGAVLTMDHGAGFKLTNLRNLVTDTFQLLHVAPDAVKTIISKEDTDKIQVVLESTANDGEGGAARVGRSLKETLDKDPRYGAMRVNLYVSEGGSPAAHTGEEPTSAMSSGGIVGLFLAILLIVIFLLAAFYFYRNRGKYNRPRLPEITLPSPPDFLRFFRPGSDRGSAAEFELHQQSVSFDNRIFEGSLAGFENPTYGDLFTTLQSDSRAHTVGPEKGGFSNPMYPTTQPTVDSKESSPPDYILYDVPPKDPPRKEAKTKPEAEQVKGDQGKWGSGAKDGSDETKVDTLSRMLMSPFRLVSSRLRRTRLEEDEVPAVSKKERPKDDAPSEETEAERKRARVKFGRPKDHERLEETGEDEEREDGERKEEKEEQRAAEKGAAGFGNPLYGTEDLGAVVDRDLGEAGTTGSGSRAEEDRTRRRRAGFENPLFEDSKEKLPKSDETRSVSVAGATVAGDESNA